MYDGIHNREQPSGLYLYLLVLFRHANNHHSVALAGWYKMLFSVDQLRRIYGTEERRQDTETTTRQEAVYFPFQGHASSRHSPCPSEFSCFILFYLFIRKRISSSQIQQT